jgi:hypothetical protein
MTIPDNYSQWVAHEKEQEAWLSTRPVCCYCDEPIQEDELMDINGKLYHTDCAIEEFSRQTDSYIEGEWL